MKNIVVVTVLCLGMAGLAAAQNEAAPFAEPAAQAQNDMLAVHSIAVGTAVSDKALQGEAKTFGASVRIVYCLTKLNVRTPGNIKFIWHKNGNRVKEGKLISVEASPLFTTWTATGVSAGSWKVELAGEDGTVLSSAEFTVE